MKLINVIWCVMFQVFKWNSAVFTTPTATSIAIGIIQRKDLQTSWTNRETLQDAINQFKTENTTYQSIDFTIHYITETNLTNVKQCYEILCTTLVPRHFQAILTTFDTRASQLLALWAGLAGISVIGTSRSISFQNKKKYTNYYYLYPPFSEEMVVLHSILDAIGMEHFAFIRGGDQESIDAVASFLSKKPKTKYYLLNLTRTKDGASKAEVVNLLENVRSLSIKVIVLVCDGKTAKKVLLAATEVGFLSSDVLWIATERVVRYVDQATKQLVPRNMIGIQLRVTPEETALRAARILYNIFTKRNVVQSTSVVCSNDTYVSLNQNTRVMTSLPPYNTSYNIVEVAENNSSSRFHAISEWSSSHGLSKSKKLFDKYKSFGSKTKQRIRIVTIEHGQYTYQVSKTLPKCPNEVSTCELSAQTCEIGVPATRYIKTDNNTYKSERICLAGLMIQLLYLFQSDFQFHYDLYLVKDSKYGGLDTETGKWNGMIGDILAGEADMALATLTTTRKRSEVVDFTFAYGEVGIGLLTAVSTDGLQSHINLDFLLPFTVLLWIVIIVTIVTVLTLIWILDKVSCTWYLKNRYARLFKKRINFLESMSFVWSTFVHIPAGSGLPRSESSRFVALFFAFATIIVCASYTAELAARKVKQEVKSPITGIFDDKMINPPQGFKYGTLKDSSTEAFFKFNKDPRLRRVYEHMKDNNVIKVEDGVKKLVSGEFQVYIDDRPYLEHLVSSRLNCSLMVVGDSLGKSGYAVALTKNSEWTNPLSLSILKYNEKNILQDLWQKWLKRKCTSKEEFGKQPAALTVQDLNGLFLVILVGTALGSIALVLENGTHYILERRSVNVTTLESLKRHDNDTVARESSATSGVRLVSHFSNRGFDETLDSREFGITPVRENK